LNLQVDLAMTPSAPTSISGAWVSLVRVTEGLILTFVRPLPCTQTDFCLLGEKLLVQLGTANPGKTQEEKQQWNDGLRSVLKDLRQKNIKDPNGIAREIAEYRRQFLNDDTRVVNL
jgi:hypothetical protein